MPRTERRKSKTGIYHVMMRGINKECIYQDNEDFNRFINILEQVKSISKFELYCYCLMDNHLHILLKELEEPISKIIKRIGTRYAYWYNKKYNRVGHLFQDRYKSECVETDKYFLVVMRYILNNPVNAGIVKRAKDYCWSSSREYYGLSNGITDKDFALGLFHNYSKNAIKQMQDFIEDNNNEEYCSFSSKRINDSEAKKEILKRLEDRNITNLKTIPKTQRDDFIRECKEIGISSRQIIETTGLGRGIVERA